MRTSRTLRRRIRNQISVAVVLALVLFALPLAIAIDQLLTSRALTSLQRDATRAIAVVPDTPVESGSPVTAPPGTATVHVAVYTRAGRRVAGSGPTLSALAAAASDGHEHHGTERGDVAVALPVLSDGVAVGSVRVGQLLSSLRHRVWVAWALLAGLALLVLAVATALARSAARRIAAPFEHITHSARELATGQTPTPPPATGIAEADAASVALYESSRQLHELLQAERNFVHQASHQLRTPLSALLLHLQHDPPDLSAALERLDHLETTIGDLLALRAHRSGERCDAGAVARRVAARRGAVEAITLRIDDTPAVAASEATVRQCLDILLDNAAQHGAAPVVLTVESYGDIVVLEVADHGAGLVEDSVAGTGLMLAGELARRAGGQLLIRQRRPHPRVALMLPVAAL